MSESEEFTFEHQDASGHRTPVAPRSDQEARMMEAIAASIGSFGVEGIVFADEDEEES